MWLVPLCTYGGSVYVKVIGMQTAVHGGCINQVLLKQIEGYYTRCLIYDKAFF